MGDIMILNSFWNLLCRIFKKMNSIYN